MQTMSACSGEGFLRDAVLVQFTVSDRLVYPGQVLMNDPAGPEIEVSNFRVAHLAFRQPNIGSARAQFAAGILAIQVIMKGSSGKKCGVAIFLCLGFSIRVNAPPIADDKHDRSCHAALCRRLGGRTRAFLLV